MHIRVGMVILPEIPWALNKPGALEIEVEAKSAPPQTVTAHSRFFLPPAESLPPFRTPLRS